MAPKRQNAAHLESLGEPMTAEENTLMSDNQAAERSPQPELELEATPAPEAQEEAVATQAATEADAQPDIDPQTGKQRKVDYGAFHQERVKRQESDKELQKARETIATFTGRFETLQQLAQQTKAPAQVQAAEIPDVNVDPVGHFRAIAENQARELKDINTWRQSQDANATAMNNVQELSRLAFQSETEFSKTTPDYGDAANHLRASRTAELKAMGYEPGAINQFITQDALTIAATALRAGLNPAAVIYESAKARGYAPKAAAAVKAPVTTSADATKLATVARGQKETTSLGQVNGSAVPEPSVEALLKMTDAEFEEATKGGKWQALMGG